MNITITGSTGFLGTHLMAKLHSLGYSPYGVTHKAYDLRSEADINALFKHTKPDIIYHLAAHLGGISYNLANPASLFYDNVKMNTELIHKAMLNGVERFIFVSSVCAYPDNAPIPMSEVNLWEGYPERSNGAYGIAKRIVLPQLEAYKEQWGMNYEYVLLTNLYGPGDNIAESGHVIAALIRKFSEATDTVEIWGDGRPTRDFLYVKDATHALSLLLDTKIGQPFNIASGSDISIKRLVEIIADLTNFKGEIVWDNTRPNGQLRRAYKTDKAKRLLNWQAGTSLIEGLKETIAWQKTK
jgi:GDP-L-fucose synthase